MKKEIVKYEVVCDCCEKELYDSGTRTNGKFGDSYLKKGNIDLCYECAGKIFYRDIVQKVPEEKLREFIDSLRNSNNSICNITAQPDIMLFKDSTKNVKDIKGARERATLSSLDEEVSLEIPGKSTSSIKPVTFLSDL